MTPVWLGNAAALGDTHALSFYDACWAATAQALDVPLVSADRKLVSSGLGETATSAARRLRL